MQLGMKALYLVFSISNSVFLVSFNSSMSKTCLSAKKATATTSSGIPVQFEKSMIVVFDILWNGIESFLNGMPGCVLLRPSSFFLRGISNEKTKIESGIGKHDDGGGDEGRRCPGG